MILERRTTTQIRPVEHFRREVRATRPDSSWVDRGPESRHHASPDSRIVAIVGIGRGPLEICDSSSRVRKTRLPDLLEMLEQSVSTISDR